VSVELRGVTLEGPFCGFQFWTCVCWSFILESFTGFTTERQTDASDRLVTFCSVKPRILNKARFAIITYINRRELVP